MLCVTFGYPPNNIPLRGEFGNSYGWFIAPKAPEI